MAVFGAVLGCVGLLMRKKWAFAVLVLSLVGILVQDFGLFVLADGASLAGPVAVAMQAFVLVIGIGLVLLARKGIARGWSEGKEVIGGYWHVLAPSFDEAVAIMAHNPTLACGLEFEIRPIDPERADARVASNETPVARAKD